MDVKGINNWLVTGGAGFIGSHIAHLLIENVLLPKSLIELGHFLPELFLHLIHHFYIFALCVFQFLFFLKKKTHNVFSLIMPHLV